MNRRQALLAALTTVGALEVSAKSRGENLVREANTLPGAVRLKIGQAMELKIQSNPVRYKGQTFSLLSIGRGVFEVDGDSHLTAKLNAGVLEWARIDYWISVAVFDAAGKLLGTASHKEKVDRIELGRTVLAQRDIALDFGISKAFASAAFVVIALSERDVPVPADAGNGEK